MLVRSPNWQSSLSDYLTSRAQIPFRYASMDCGLFVANAIEAMTEIDVAAPLRGTYKNRREAFTAIKALCGKPTMEAVAEWIARSHGIPQVPVLFAHRGDPVLLRHGHTSSLGLIAMHGTEILTPYKDGLLRLPLSHATRAWHI